MAVRITKTSNHLIHYTSREFDDQSLINVQRAQCRLNEKAKSILELEKLVRFSHESILPHVLLTSKCFHLLLSKFTYPSSLFLSSNTQNEELKAVTFEFKVR